MKYAIALGSVIIVVVCLCLLFGTSKNNNGKGFGLSQNVRIDELKDFKPAWSEFILSFTRFEDVFGYDISTGPAIFYAMASGIEIYLKTGVFPDFNTAIQAVPLDYIKMANKQSLEKVAAGWGNLSLNLPQSTKEDLIGQSTALFIFSTASNMYIQKKEPPEMMDAINETDTDKVTAARLKMMCNLYSSRNNGVKLIEAKMLLRQIYTECQRYFAENDKYPQSWTFNDASKGGSLANWKTHPQLNFLPPGKMQLRFSFSLATGKDNFTITADPTNSWDVGLRNLPPLQMTNTGEVTGG
jgi:hypothetical protein